jgi:cytidine deaminase
VGAAILTDSGKVYSAPYFESIIQGLGTCAERNAVGSAIADGECKFKAVAFVGEQEEPISPCGACRQILAEFSGVAQHDIIIIMHRQSAETKIESLKKLMPDSFSPEDAGAVLEEYR